jgi:Ecdysteroid kinase-like family
VLEDLKITHYQTLPKHIDPAINHIKMALRSLAAFHAANIIYERLELRPKGSTIGDTYSDMLFETSYAPDNPWCMTGIRALKAVALHKTKYGFGSSYEQAIEEKFIGKVCKIFELLEAPESLIPRVSCHRDLWKNNLMYRFENGSFDHPSHCLLIDFQICRYLPLTLDVIICIMLPSQDHSNTDECLKFYFEQLSSSLLSYAVHLDEVMTWSDFESSCRRFQLVPLVQQGMFWSLTNLPDAVIPDLLSHNESEYIRICQESRDDIVLKYIETDEYYQNSMTGSVERLVEYLFIDKPTPNEQ